MFSIVSIFFFGAWQTGQTNAITLKDEGLNFTPSEFFIADVINEQPDNRPSISLIDNAAHPLPRLINLKAGTAGAIKHFIAHNLPVDTALHPVVLTIKTFRLAETPAENDNVNGKLTIDFSFGLKRAYGIVHLIEYNGSIEYTRTSKQPADPEPILRHGIESALTYFNKWINKAANGNVLLAKRVKVSFSDYTQKPEGDTIYYSVNRPLTWTDFQEKPRESNFEAEVFTSIGYNERTEVVKGTIDINIELKVELAKSDCWVRGRGADNYALNHEQRHFDIEKIVAERFKHKVMSMHLPVDNYDGPINVEYLETLREATRMQKQYDAETRHGLNTQAQAEWNDKIDKELREYGVKK
ncbi:MAG: hypothetical protein ACTHJ8_02010 [Mucilaginibacter sp.]